MNNLNLGLIPYQLHDNARQAFDEGNVVGFLGLASNERSLDIVWDNAHALRTRDIFEKALVEAITATRVNSRKQYGAIEGLASFADRCKLLSAGDPLPGQGPFQIFRGVSGRGRARRIRGFSWTADLERAQWFATRFQELGDPAVFEAMVEVEHVLFYSNERQEQEFVILLPPSIHPKRIWRGP